MKNITDYLKTANSQSMALGIATFIAVIVLHILNLMNYIVVSTPVLLFAGVYIGNLQGILIYLANVLLQMIIFSRDIKGTIILIIIALIASFIFQKSKIVKQKKWLTMSVLAGVASYFIDGLSGNIVAISSGYSGISSSWDQSNVIRAISAGLIFAGLCYLWKNMIFKKQ